MGCRARVGVAGRMKLIILNGPSGVGKSTVAARLCSQIPASVLIDIDELRRTIPDYREKREESLRLAHELAVNTIGNSLGGGHSVIVDKAISDSGTLDSFIELGKKHGAEVYEFILFTDKETLQRRADARGYRPGSLLTRERVGEMWEEANSLREQRPNAIVIDTTFLSIDETFSNIETIVSEGRPQ